MHWSRRCCVIREYLQAERSFLHDNFFFSSHYKVQTLGAHCRCLQLILCAITWKWMIHFRLIITILKYIFFKCQYCTYFHYLQEPCHCGAQIQGVLISHPTRNSKKDLTVVLLFLNKWQNSGLKTNPQIYRKPFGTCPYRTKCTASLCLRNSKEGIHNFLLQGSAFSCINEEPSPSEQTTGNSEHSELHWLRGELRQALLQHLQIMAEEESRSSFSSCYSSLYFATSRWKRLHHFVCSFVGHCRAAIACFF